MTTSRTILLSVAAAAAGQAVVWLAAAHGILSSGLAAALLLAIAWALILALILSSSSRIDALQNAVDAGRDEHRSTKSQVEQLETLNEMLLTLGRSRDVGLAFQGLARRVGGLVPCDRLVLALIKEGSQDLQTYSARVSEPERRKRPRPELEYGLDRSLFGQAIRTCETVLAEDLAEYAREFDDASIFASQGFKTAFVVPLLSRNRAIGALMLISRRKDAFAAGDHEVIQPLAEILAFAFLSQQQHAALARYKTMDTLAEMSLSLAADINSALQTIIGQGGVLQMQQPSLEPDIEVIVKQAERISDLLDRMRRASHERLGESAISSSAIPSSPEAFAEEEEAI